MAHDIDRAVFQKNVSILIDEVFQKVTGYVLDQGTSMLETIATVSADEASRPLVEGGSTVAGHTAHVRFYLAVAKQYMEGQPPEKTDWKESWRVHAVSDAEWNALRQGLTDDYKELRERVAATADWNDDDQIAELIAVITHTAFHLGAIRQMIIAVRN